MTVSNRAVPVDHKDGWPEIASVVAPDFLRIVGDYRKADLHPLYSLTKLRGIFLVVRAGHVDTNDNQPLAFVFTVQLADMRHCFDTGSTVERPEIHQHHFPLKRFQRERRRIDPDS